MSLWNLIALLTCSKNPGKSDIKVAKPYTCDAIRIFEYTGKYSISWIKRACFQACFVECSVCIFCYIMLIRGISFAPDWA